MNSVTLALSPGEVIDRLTILELKVAHAPEGSARDRVEAERDRLKQALQTVSDLESVATLTADLAGINGQLWDVEDALRAHEVRQDFGPAFVAHARSVYVLNDQRAALKRAIDVALGAVIRDEKVYAGGV